MGKEDKFKNFISVEHVSLFRLAVKRDTYQVYLVYFQQVWIEFSCKTNEEEIL